MTRRSNRKHQTKNAVVQEQDTTEGAQSVLGRFTTPNLHAAEEVERWAEALKWVAGVNGLAVGVALSYAMTAYSAMDSSCEKHLFLAEALNSAARLGWMFASIGVFTLAFSLTPVLLRGSIHWLRQLRRLPYQHSKDNLNAAWGGFLFVIASAQRMVLLVGWGLFCLGIVWALNFASAQKPEVLESLWRKFEQQCASDKGA